MVGRIASIWILNGIKLYIHYHLNQYPFAGDDEGTLAALFVLERAGLILSGMKA